MRAPSRHDEVFAALLHVVDRIAEAHIAQHTITHVVHHLLRKWVAAHPHPRIAALLVFIHPCTLNHANQLVRVMVEQQRRTIIQAGQVHRLTRVREDLIPEVARDRVLRAERELQRAVFVVNLLRSCQRNRLRSHHLLSHWIHCSILQCLNPIRLGCRPTLPGIAAPCGPCHTPRRWEAILARAEALALFVHLMPRKPCRHGDHGVGTQFVAT